MNLEILWQRCADNVVGAIAATHSRSRVLSAPFLMHSMAQQETKGENSHAFVRFHQKRVFFLSFFLPLIRKLFHLDIQINDVSFPYANLSPKL